MSETKSDPVQIFKTLADFTFSRCKQDCKNFNCCNKAQCLDTIEFCKETYGIDLPTTNHPTLPLMGENGCTALPHQRPICSVHICDKFLSDQSWSEQYFEIRETASDALEAILEQAENNLQPKE